MEGKAKIVLLDWQWYDDGREDTILDHLFMRIQHLKGLCVYLLYESVLFFWYSLGNKVILYIINVLVGF